jgi:hypothetical protein
MRREFLLGMIDKKKLELINKFKEERKDIIHFLSQGDHDYLIMEYYGSNLGSSKLTCLDDEKISSGIKINPDPTFSNYMVTSQYFENLSKQYKYKYLQITKTKNNDINNSSSTELMKYEDTKNLINLIKPLEKNVESVLCKNYINIGNNAYSFEDIIKNKDSSACQYLHLILPIKRNVNAQPFHSISDDENKIIS